MFISNALDNDWDIVDSWMSQVCNRVTTKTSS
jgi:hypothetical protein